MRPRLFSTQPPTTFEKKTIMSSTTAKWPTTTPFSDRGGSSAQATSPNPQRSKMMVSTDQITQ
jgi:hypothetical protein